MSSREAEAARIFLEAVEHCECGRRAEFVREAAAGDPILLQRVDALLKAHDEPNPLLDGDHLAPTRDIPQPSERPGTVIGPHKLLEQIGEGGMGLVFVAEQQQPVKRRVALKVIKPGMDSRQVIARFEAERQALAMMDHPHIAKVHDGGTTPEDRPYFVMELVKGTPITDYCDRHRLSNRQRLQLFLDVCHAVQHAHQKGIIHRDLKPSNVLVEIHDVQPVLKVIDFGIAKAMGQQLTDKTVYTAVAQMVGTPLYMSPEQAGLSSLDVDTRSDVYSLGVLLYELLTGTTPFDHEQFKQASYDEMRRIIREDEPPRPSTRLSTIEQAALSTIAEKRGLEPRRLSQQLRGELDWIVMKCLEKDRNRRYGTANSLARDIERYLNDEPVQACPPSAWYRFRKFARRNKHALATVGLLAVILVLAVIELSISNIHINRERDQTEKALKAAEANLSLARQAVDEMYTKVAYEVSARPYMQPFQRDILEKALRFYQQFAQRQSGDPALRLETASARLRIGQVQFTLGQPRQAMRACNEAIAALEELGAELPAEPNRCFWLADAYCLRGSIHSSGGEPGQVATQFRQALALQGQFVPEQPDDPGYWSRLASTHLQLGSVQSDHPGEAEKEIREGVRLYERLAAQPRSAIPYRESLISSYIALGAFLAGVDRFQEAEQAFRQALDLCDTFGESLTRTNGQHIRASAESALGQVLAAHGRRPEAEKAYRRAIASAEKCADQFPDVPGYRLSLAQYSAKLAALLAQSGKRDEAAVYRRSARKLFEKLAAEFSDEEEWCDFFAGTWGCLRDAGDLETAEQFGRKALTAAAKRAEGSTDPFDRRRVAKSHCDLGVVLQRRGHPRDAANQFRQGSMLFEQLAAEFPDEAEYRYLQVNMLNSQGIALRMQPGEAAAALPCHRQAIALCDKLVVECPERHVYRIQLVRAHFALGLALRLCERPAEAVQALQQALDAYRPYSGAASSTENQGQFASIHNELAWLLATYPDTQFRDPGRPVATAQKAVELEPNKGEFWDTLGVSYYRAGQWRESKEALAKSMTLLGWRSESSNTFFLAMAHWQLGEREESRRCYRQAVAWMENNQPSNEELRRFCAEAEELLGIRGKKNSPQKNADEHR
jgi:serine/threonine protein kinase